MTREDLDFIGSMNMCDEISNEAYKKIMCHCEEQEPCNDAVSRQAVLDGLASIAKGKAKSDQQKSLMGRTMFFVEQLTPVTPAPKMGHWDCGDDMFEYAICSSCKYETGEAWEYAKKNFKYCPNCGSYNGSGAKMSEIPTGSEKPNKWIPVSERLPEDIRPVMVTWKNNDPASYYQYIVGKHFIGVAHYLKGKWYWYSSTTEDFLAEYGRYEGEEFDEAIEVVAWCELPEPFKESEGEE